MRFLIITHALHFNANDKIYSYAPYVREMNLWLKYVDKVEIVAPFQSLKPTKIDLAYTHNNIETTQIPEISLTSFLNVIKTLLFLPIILFKLFLACRRADHIHLRCPGNIGLLGCFVQIFFPNKVKTAKYAGNWDPNAKQPKSYKIQKWILNQTTLTKNMTVLVYGQWKNQSKNIKPFFTATYNNSERINYNKKDFTKPLKFIFVGSLVEGKRPLFAVKLIEQLQLNNINCELHLFGDGVLRTDLETYVSNKKLNGIVLHGNQTKQVLKKYIEESHFSILASKSEGWPKALAEAMFFGVVPIATKISCVPYMLGNGKRGILIEPDLNSAKTSLLNHLKDLQNLNEMSFEALKWSQSFTLDLFESEIKKLITN